MKKVITTAWHPDQQLIITKLSGELNSEDVKQWKDSLDRALVLIPDQSSFKILVDRMLTEASPF